MIETRKLAKSDSFLARFGCFMCLPRVQPGLPEEEMFKRLCALNEAEAKECKVCNNSIEAAGR